MNNAQFLVLLTYGGDGEGNDFAYTVWNLSNFVYNEINTTWN